MENKVVEPGKWKQFLAAVVVNLAALSYGIVISWGSPVIPALEVEPNPIGIEALTTDQASWLNAVSCVGGIILLPLCNAISERFGRKMIGYFIAISLVVSWILIIFATNFIYLLIARAVAGIGGAFCFFLVPIYVYEIAGSSIRGQLGSLFVFAVNIGILCGYTLGATLSYELFAICAMMLPVIFLGCFAFLPETPVYLIRKKRPNEAFRSLMWLKNSDKTAAENELQHLTNAVKSHANLEKTVGVRDLFRDRGTIKGFIIALALMGGQQTCGISAMLMYTGTIFKTAGSSLPPNTAAIIVGVIQVIGSWLSTVMMEKAGRKLLILISCFGMALCHIALGSFFFLQSTSYDVLPFSWIPLASLSIFVVVYSLGMGPCPFVVSSEIFSSDISGLANSIAMVFMFNLAFTTVKYFTLYIQLVGNAGCFFSLALCCMATFFFTIYVVPETKSKSIETILDELNGVKDRDSYIKASPDILDQRKSSHLV